MDPYETIAIFKCIAAGTKAEDVGAMGYAQIAGLAGVTLGKNGESPADFFYVNVRRKVANDLGFYSQYGFLPAEAADHPDVMRIAEIDKQRASLAVEKAELQSAISARGGR